MQKINFINNSQPYLNANTLNEMQDNIENEINDVKQLMSDVYSTAEVKTNKVWIDGKPIYRSVVVISDEIINDSSFSHNIENADLIYIEKAFINNITSNITWDLPIDLYGAAGTVTTDRVSVFVDRTKVTFKCDTSWGINWNKYIILEYTKTTD